MKYQPTPEDLAYLAAVREDRKLTAGLSAEKKFFTLAAMPVQVYNEMKRQHGSKWAQKPSVLLDFLKKNPIYQVGNPDKAKGEKHVKS